MTVHASCSFCTKSVDEAGTLVCGPKIYICEDCVELAAEAIQETKDRRWGDNPLIGPVPLQRPPERQENV